MRRFAAFVALLGLAGCGRPGADAVSGRTVAIHGKDVPLSFDAYYVDGHNVTGDDPILTAKIALAHLKELTDYYTRLTKMEAEAEGRSER
jgi:hypothetical protein